MSNPTHRRVIHDMQTLKQMVQIKNPLQAPKLSSLLSQAQLMNFEITRLEPCNSVVTGARVCLSIRFVPLKVLQSHTRFKDRASRSCFVFLSKLCLSFLQNLANIPSGYLT